MLQAGRTKNAGGYRFGFNGMEQTKGVQGDGAGTFYDYKNRDYDPWIIRFKRTDALEAKYPFYSPYQFAGNKPINSIDLDGLEEYITIDGQYLGRPTNSTSEELRVVTSADAAKYSNNVDNMHNNSISYRTLPTPTYDTETKESSTTPMTMGQFLDVAHVIYGEGSVKSTDALKMANVIYNGEIKTNLQLNKLRTTAFGVNPKTGAKIMHDATNASLIKQYEDTGNTFNLNLSLIGKPRTWDIMSDVLHNGGTPYEWKVDGTKLKDENGNYVINKRYDAFFAKKHNVPLLTQTLNQIPIIFKAIIDSRLEITPDPCPNYDSWYGANGKNNYYNGRHYPNSDKIKK
jgi:RHS repeat-associated protein